MTVLAVDPELTFSQSEIKPVTGEYVCAVCHSDLTVQHIQGDSRVFIMCPEHGNVCLCGRVMRSTVNILLQAGSQEYYSMIASMPDLYANLWVAGIPREQAGKIARESVCGLCGGEIVMQVILDSLTNTIDPERVSLICRAGHGNVGLNGIGFVAKASLPHVPPVEWRRIARLRSGRELGDIAPVLSDSASFDKLGVITVRDRMTETLSTHFNVIFFGDRTSAERFKERLGDKPSRLQVRIPSPTFGGIVRESLECYRKGALIAKAVNAFDEWVWQYYRDPDTHEIEIRGGTPLTLDGQRLSSQPVQPGQVLYHDANGSPRKVQRVLRMRFVLPQLAEEKIVGYFDASFRDSDADTISSGVRIIESTAKEHGFMLSEIPLVLSVDAEQGVGVAVDPDWLEGVSMEMAGGFGDSF